MTATVEAVTLETVIEKTTPEQRRYLVQKLLPKVLAETSYLPQQITNAAGDTVGFFIPRYRSTTTEPPKLTAEREAELRGRLDTLDDSVDLEEFLKLLDREDARLSTQR
jgi:hypothetical protein